MTRSIQKGLLASSGGRGIEWMRGVGGQRSSRSWEEGDSMACGCWTTHEVELRCGGLSNAPICTLTENGTPLTHGLRHCQSGALCAKHCTAHAPRCRTNPASQDPGDKTFTGHSETSRATCYRLLRCSDHQSLDCGDCASAWKPSTLQKPKIKHEGTGSARAFAIIRSSPLGQGSFRGTCFPLFCAAEMVAGTPTCESKASRRRHRHPLAPPRRDDETDH